MSLDRINLFDFTTVTNLTFGIEHIDIGIAVTAIDVDGGFLYFASLDTAALTVRKINLDTFEEVLPALELSINGAWSPLLMLIDTEHHFLLLFIGGYHDEGGEVGTPTAVKIDLVTLAEGDHLTLSELDDNIVTDGIMDVDNDAAYFGTYLNSPPA